MSWNVRGVNRFPKQSEVRQVIAENKISLCAILESHVQPSNLNGICSRIFRNWSWSSNGNVCEKYSRVIVGWDTNVMDLMILSQSDQVVHTQISLKSDRKVIFFSFIYAHNSYLLRRQLWQNLLIHNNFVNNQPWIVMGDFNTIMNLDESTSCASSRDISMVEFKDCIQELEILDLKFTGLQYTWNQKPKGDSGLMKKLDRIMGNQVFNDIFPGSYVEFQPYRISDHTPAILSIPLSKKFCPKPFKFSNVLISHAGFKQVVTAGWNIEVEGYYMFSLIKKLKNLKKPLRKLLYDKGNLHVRVNKLRMEVDSVQRSIDADPFNQILREDQAALVNALNDAILDEERFLKQKAKVEWLKLISLVIGLIVLKMRLEMFSMGRMLLKF
ncbi:uncharacterized protein LOC143600808 [Bidens hawaiensis]|uniref:uncharacterized protein LOC143600808 n=1 Tax=Bidens hawaiensis TaxID=980011 RepID=UPI004049DF47